MAGEDAVISVRSVVAALHGEHEIAGPDDLAMRGHFHPRGSRRKAGARSNPPTEIYGALNAINSTGEFHPGQLSCETRDEGVRHTCNAGSSRVCRF